MKRTLAACLALTATLALACGPATARQTSTPATSSALARVSADPEHGHTLSYTCQGCHGVSGYKNAYPNYHVPRIGGQSAQYLTQALTEYQSGKRTHPTMQAQASSFSAQDIADLAAYLSTLK